MRLSATRKLFDRLPLDAAGSLAPTPHSAWLYDGAPLESNPLGGWHGNLVTLQRRNCVLLLHEATHLALVLPALTKPDFAEFNRRFVDALMNTLLKVGADDTHLDTAHRHLRPLHVAAHCDRSAQGVLNQLKFELEHELWYGSINIADETGYRLGARLSDRPMFTRERKAIWAPAAFLDMLDELAVGSVQPSPSGLGGKAPSAGPGTVVSLEDWRKKRDASFDVH